MALPLGELASECETERARMLTAKYRPDDSITLTKGLPITVRRLSGDRLALSVTCGDTSPKGRGIGRPVNFV